MKTRSGFVSNSSSSSFILDMGKISEVDAELKFEDFADKFNDLFDGYNVKTYVTTFTKKQLLDDDSGNFDDYYDSQWKNKLKQGHMYLLVEASEPPSIFNDAINCKFEIVVCNTHC